MTAGSDAAKPVSVVLTDDHRLIRHAMRALLDKSTQFSVVGEARDAEETLDLLKQHSPDLLILDVGLPGKSGIELIYEIRQQHLSPKIAVLTMYEDEEKVRQALGAGANGYIYKDVAPKDLLSALDRVISGELVIPEQFNHLREELASGSLSNGHGRDSADPLSKLSKREREVFHLIASGMPNRVIARKLFISPRTVETHRARVIKKLGFSSTADLVRFAIKNNLLGL